MNRAAVALVLAFLFLMAALYAYSAGAGLVALVLAGIISLGLIVYGAGIIVVEVTNRQLEEDKR